MGGLPAARLFFIICPSREDRKLLTRPAVAGDKANAEQGIENHHWRIAKYRGEVPPDFRPPPGFPPSEVTQQTDKEGLIDANFADIIFLNGRVRGSTGCGGWAGTYTLSGDRLVFQADFALFGTCDTEGFAQGPVVVNAFKGELKDRRKRRSYSSARQQRENAHIACAVLSLQPYKNGFGSTAGLVW